MEAGTHTHTFMCPEADRPPPKPVGNCPVPVPTHNRGRRYINIRASEQSKEMTAKWSNRVQKLF